MQETESIDEYILQHIDAESDYLKALYRDTHVKLLRPRMASGHLQGRMLKMFVEMIRPRHILEIGTYSGYSALCLAVGLDKSHRSAVTGVTLQRSEKGLTVRVESDSPSPIERDCLERMAKSIAKALNSPIEILWTDPIGGEVKDGVPETAIKAWRRKKANRKKKSKLKKAKNKLKKKHHKK